MLAAMSVTKAMLRVATYHRRVGHASEQDVIGAAHEWMRANLSGFIRFDGERVAIKVIVAPDGHLVAPVMVAMLMATEVVIELPDDTDGALHLMVTLSRFEERGELGALCDRWRIYHGDPPDVNWARIGIDAARFDGYFLDGEALMRPNPLAAGEAAACSAINRGDRSVIAGAARACGGHELASPRVVGIDPAGADVRSDFGVVRLRWAAPISAAADATAALGSLAGR